MVELTVKLASGNLLGKVNVEETSTGADVKASLQSFVREGNVIGHLCVGSQIFHDNQTVRDLSNSSYVSLQAVLVVAKPRLHLFKPCSAMKLSKRHGHWACDGGSDDEWEGPDGMGNFCLPKVRHRSMECAPPLARKVAEELRAHLKSGAINIVCVGNNYGATGEVIPISHTGVRFRHRFRPPGIAMASGSNPKEAILSALGVRREDLRFDSEREELISPASPGKGFDIWAEAEFQGKDWSKDVIGCGLSRDNLGDGSEDPDLAKAVAISDVMAKSLVRHFEFGMNRNRHECMKCPMVWGGFTSDGCIVGVLGSFLNR